MVKMFWPPKINFSRFWPHKLAYCCAIQAGRVGRQWDISLSMIASCEEQQLSPDTPILNAAIGACGYGREWQHAVALLSDAQMIFVVYT